MPVLEFSTHVPASLARVWAFHEDVPAALPALSPPGARVVVVSADLPVRVGSRIVIRAAGPLGVPVRWVARIVEHVPPEQAPASTSAHFIDEQECGPIAAWRHEHRFESVSPDVTRLVDRVTYRVRFGPFGAVADRLFVRRQVVQMFRHRHAALARMFASGAPAQVHSPA